ncbi:winged helix-turn-helix transcriptional regulator, partial [Nanoarchaeota archaeon]
MGEVLDKKDMRILYELDVNARQPISQIAKKVGLSKEVVNYRIKNLTKKGIIEGFYTIIDSAKLGYFTIRVYLTLGNTTVDKEKEIIDFIVKQKNALYVSKLSNSLDVAIGMWVKTFDEFAKFKNELETKYRKYLSIFLIYNHYKRDYLINENKGESAELAVIGTPHEIKISDTEHRLLKLIADNARISLLDISKKIGVTPNAVKYT